MKKLTKKQCVVLTGFTGTMCCESFPDFHEDVEKDWEDLYGHIN